MSFTEKIAAARREAALITANSYFDIRDLDRMHKEDGCIYVCEDGKCVDVDGEEA